MDVVIGSRRMGVDQYTFRVQDVLGQGFQPHSQAAVIGAMADAAEYRPRQQERHHYRAPPSYDDIMQMAEESDDDAGSKKRRKQYINTGMPWRLEFIELYGHPKDPSECFGCIYNTLKSKITVPRRDMEIIIKMMRSCPASMAPEALAVQLSEKQVEMARRINANKALDDETRIPEWDPATVLDHLETHLQAPALNTRILYGKMLRWVKYIEENTLLRVDKHDGDTSMDPLQLRCAKDILQTAQGLSKNKFKDMAFHQPGAVLNEEQVGSYVAQDAFRLINTLKKRKRSFE